MLTFLLTLSVPSNAQSSLSKSCHLSVKISGQAFQPVIFYRNSNDFKSIIRDTLQFDKNAEVEYSFPISRSQYLNMVHNKSRQQIFFEPGKHISIEVDTANNVLHFAGDLAKENQYLENAFHKDKIALAPYHWSSTDQQPIDSLVAKIDRWKKAKKAILNRYFPNVINQKSIFYQLQLMEWKAKGNYAIIDHIKLYYTAGPKRDQRILDYTDKDFLDFEKMASYLEADYVRFLYNGTLKDYFKAKHYGEKSTSRQRNVGYHAFSLEIIDRYYESPVKEICLVRGLDNLFADIHNYADRYTPIPVLLKKYGKKAGSDQIQAWSTLYEQSIVQSKRYQAGQPLPSIVLKNIDGSDFQLDSPNSLPVLYDLWASWCAPCKKAFPKVEALAEKYQGRLNVYTISLDKHQSKHQAALKKGGIPGSKHLWAEGGFESTFAKYFQISAIPRYLLVDNQGHIVTIGYMNDVKKGLKRVGL